MEDEKLTPRSVSFSPCSQKVYLSSVEDQEVDSNRMASDCMLTCVHAYLLACLHGSNCMASDCMIAWFNGSNRMANDCMIAWLDGSNCMANVAASKLPLPPVAVRLPL